MGDDEWWKFNRRCSHGWLRSEQCEICNAPKREWVGLTDEAVGFECRKHFWMHGTRFEDAYMAGFRDAEAAHGIKEGT